MTTPVSADSPVGGPPITAEDIVTALGSSFHSIEPFRRGGTPPSSGPADATAPLGPPPGDGAAAADDRFTSTPPIGPPPSSLYRQFVEMLIAEAMLDIGRSDPQAPAPLLRWSALWAVAADVPSPERAVGRTILVADEVAREMRVRARVPGAEAPAPASDQMRAEARRRQARLQRQVRLSAQSPPSTVRLPPARDEVLRAEGFAPDVDVEEVFRTAGFTPRVEVDDVWAPSAVSEPGASPALADVEASLLLTAEAGAVPLPTSESDAVPLPTSESDAMPLPTSDAEAALAPTPSPWAPPPANGTATATHAATQALVDRTIDDALLAPARPITLPPRPEASPPVGRPPGAVGDSPATVQPKHLLVPADDTTSKPTKRSKGSRRSQPRPARSKADRRTRRWRVVLATSTWVRNIGAVLIAFAAWQLWGTAITQHNAQSSIRVEFQQDVITAGRTGTPSVAAIESGKAKLPPEPLIPASRPVPQPTDGAVVARLQLPAIGIDQYVVQGTDETDLSMGPGHYVGTAMPGQAGNVAIAGHRTTYGAPFDRLDQVVVGDSIFLTTTTGEVLRYVVNQGPFAVDPSDVGVLDNFGDNRLTLTTCTPKFSATQRLVVVATLQHPAAAPSAAAARKAKTGAATTPTTGAHTGATSTTLAPSTGSEPSPTNPVPYRGTRHSSVGWNLGVAPWAALWVSLLLALGLLHRRLSKVYGRGGRWIVLTPVWAAGLFVLFEALSRLIPATL